MEASLFSRRFTTLAAFFFVVTSFSVVYFSAAFKEKLFLVFAGAFFVLSSLLLFVTASRKYRIRRHKTRILPGVLAVGAVTVALILNFLLTEAPRSEALKYDGSIASVKAEITDVVSEEYGYCSVYEAVSRSIDGEGREIRMRLEFEYAAELSVGDVVEFTDTLRIPDDTEQNYCLPSGILLICETDEPLAVVGKADASLFSLIRRLGDRIETIFELNLNKDAAAMSSALLIGRKDGLSYSFTRDIRRLGISHLLALSGMHLTLLCGGISFFLSLCRVGKNARCVILILFSAFYTVLTGASPSIVRAAVMLILSNFAFLVGRRYDSLTALMLSVAGIMIFSPFSAYDIGLILSFLSMFSIVAVSGPLSLKLRRRIIRRIPSALVSFIVSFIVYSALSSLFAWIFSLPVLILAFGEVSLVSLPMTLIFSVPIEIYIVGSVVLTALSACGLSSASAVISEALNRLSAVISDSAGKFSRIRGVTAAVNYNFAQTAAFVLLAVFFVIVLFSRKRHALRIFTAGALSVAVVFGGIAVYNRECSDEVRIVYSNYAESDFLALSSGGEVLLCEISNGGYSKLRSSINGADQLHFTEIDTFMVTDYHNNSPATLEKLLGNYIVRKILLPELFVSDDSEVRERMIQIAVQAGIPFEIYSFGEYSNEVGNCTVEAVQKRMLSRSVQPTVLLRFSYNNASLYFMGASFWEDYLYDVDFLCADASAIIVGSHGPVVKTDIETEKKLIETRDGTAFIALK